MDSRILFRDLHVRHFSPILMIYSLAVREYILQDLSHVRLASPFSNSVSTNYKEESVLSLP